jgi:hypothetical protein
LLIALYSVRSKRQFCEQLDYNLLFRWFLDMNMVEESFDPTVFTKNRERLLNHEVGRLFFDAIVRKAREARLMSDDHFTVDGTLIEAWASLKSFRLRGEEKAQRPPDEDLGNPTVDFHGEKRSNKTHESTTDPESRLMRKGRGKEAKLCYGAHVLMENRNGLLVDLEVTKATATAEEDAAETMLRCQGRKGIHPKTLGGDKGYDTRDFVATLRKRQITPHVAANTERRGGSAIDGRTTRHRGYEIIRQGDMIIFDIAGVGFNGYFVDYVRCWPFAAKFTPEQKEAYKRCYNSLYSAINAIKPGNTTADAVIHFTRCLDDEYTWTGLNSVHSIGLGVYEGLMMTRGHSFDFPEPIEQNMYFAVETLETTPGNDWSVRLKENGVVTDKGFQSFSLFPSRKKCLEEGVWES